MFQRKCRRNNPPRQLDDQIAVESSERPALAGYNAWLNYNTRVVGFTPQRETPDREPRTMRAKRFGTSST